MKNSKSFLFIFICTLFLFGCEALFDEDEATNKQCNPYEGNFPNVDRVLNYTTGYTGGFDDFGSSGAAFGYSINEGNNSILAIAIRFRLPLSQKCINVTGDAVSNAQAYLSTPPVLPILDDVTSYPLLSYVSMNTGSIRTSNTEFSAVYIQGDLQSDLPEKVFIADMGTIQFSREDGPSDFIEGTIRLREITDLGDSPTFVPNGETIEISRIFFGWDTGDQNF